MRSRLDSDDSNLPQRETDTPTNARQRQRPILLPAANLESLSDEDLVSQLQAGYHDALTVLFERYSGMVFQIARRMLKDHGEAEEAVQQVFLDLYKAIDQFDRSKGSCKTWIFQFVYHRTINRRNHLEAKGFYVAEEFHEDLLPAELLEGSGRPFQLSSQEIAYLIGQLLDTIQPRQRRTIELTFFEGLTAEEIAARTGETAAVVRHNLYRGINSLRTALLHQPSAEKDKVRKELEGVFFAYTPRAL
jgi:RNA polymerase sigma-70 factor (ECF subfamily)